MARQLQDEEPMQNITVRMPTWMVSDIDAYRAKLKANNLAFRVERGEAVRDLLLKALALVGGNGPSGPGDAWGGPVLAPVQVLSPLEEDHSGTKAAPTQDQPRTTGRTGRKRVKAVQEG
jgi:hypothetical protein